MGQFLLLVVVALTVGAVVFGVTVLLTGGDGGLSPAEPDGRAVPLPATRPLAEPDIAGVRFDVTARGYRMAQVDQAMHRAAYDIGYKDELINVLEAEVDALRSGRHSDAEVLRRAREAAQAAAPSATAPALPTGDDGDDQNLAAINLGEAVRESTGAPRPAVAGAEPAGAEPAGIEPAGAERGEIAEAGPAEAGPARAGQAAAEPTETDPTGAQKWTTDATGDHGDQGGQGADADRGGDGSDEPEADSIMPSRR